ncbi:MFS transporter [Allonocardiopsis opalescens]|uniref:DHA2 family multidrug resistance protein-like MFS transporter n=1 Tax=Allonocardiopsis opalescens TaxID=1144618 RepID=A0A2T0Q7A1_9ACTN|nr:MFS transporter [Allonocardiopsis opalescens]PRX99682.1 DHA2 family multidrug resistance protein-like MFS transporter [Allonocardiopsis opalescens]
MTTPAPSRAGWREWLGLAVLVLPLFILAVDMTVLLLAMPSISADLRPGAAEMLWIMHVYGFLIAGFLITMGRLGDRVGRRRLLLVGSAAFAGVSVFAAFSTSAEALIASRALLGVAGASLMPSVYALLRPMFRDRRQFTLAIAILVSTFTVGTALGPLVGGIVLEYFWWGAVFLINVPPVLVLLAVGPFVLPEHRSPGVGPLDLPSVLLSLAGMLGIIYGIQETAEHGFGAVPTAVAALGALAATVFVRRQLRLADPLLDLRLFANRAFSVSLVGVVTVGIGGMGAELFLAQYLQSVLGLRPLEAGLLMVLPAAVGLVGTMSAPALARRMRPAYAMGGGLLLSAAGYLLIGVAGDGLGLAVALSGLLLAMFGQGPTWTLGSDLILATSPPERVGSASAMQEVSGELGGALGMALVGSAGMVVYRSALAGSMPGDVPPEAAAAALDSVGAAGTAAADLPAGTAEGLLAAAHESFTAAAQTGFALAAVLSALGAVMFGVLLRDVRSGAEHVPDTDGTEPAAAAPVPEP